VLVGAERFTVVRPRSFCTALIRLELLLRFTELAFLLPVELLRLTAPELRVVDRLLLTVPELRLVD